METPLKVGDRVQIAKTGMIGILVDIRNYNEPHPFRVDFSDTDSLGSSYDSFERVHLVKVEFKVGDRVKVTDKGVTYYGKDGVVASVASFIIVKFDKEDYNNFEPNQLTKITKDEPVLKVGDKVRFISSPPKELKSPSVGLNWEDSLKRFHGKRAEISCVHSDGRLEINLLEPAKEYQVGKLVGWVFAPEWFVKDEPIVQLFEKGDRVCVIDDDCIKGRKAGRAFAWLPEMGKYCCKVGVISSCWALDSIPAAYNVRFNDGQLFGFYQDWLAPAPINVGDWVRVLTPESSANKQWCEDFYALDKSYLMPIVEPKKEPEPIKEEAMSQPICIKKEKPAATSRDVEVGDEVVVSGNAAEPLRNQKGIIINEHDDAFALRTINLPGFGELAIYYDCFLPTGNKIAKIGDRVRVSDVTGGLRWSAVRIANKTGKIYRVNETTVTVHFNLESSGESCSSSWDCEPEWLTFIKEEKVEVESKNPERASTPELDKAIANMTPELVTKAKDAKFKPGDRVRVTDKFEPLLFDKQGVIAFVTPWHKNTIVTVKLDEFPEEYSFLCDQLTLIKEEKVEAKFKIGDVVRIGAWIAGMEDANGKLAIIRSLAQSTGGDNYYRSRVNANVSQGFCYRQSWLNKVEPSTTKNVTSITLTDGMMVKIGDMVLMTEEQTKEGNITAFSLMTSGEVIVSVDVGGKVINFFSDQLRRMTIALSDGTMASVGDKVWMINPPSICSISGIHRDSSGGLMASVKCDNGWLNQSPSDLASHLSRVVIGDGTIVSVASQVRVNDVSHVLDLQAVTITKIAEVYVTVKNSDGYYWNMLPSKIVNLDGLSQIPKKVAKVNFKTAKIGDRVRVISKPPTDMRNMWCSASMEPLCGKEGIISSSDVTINVKFKDDRTFSFYPEWLEEVSKRPFKFGDKVRVNATASGVHGKIGKVLGGTETDIQVALTDNTGSDFHPSCLDLVEESKERFFKVGDKVQVNDNDSRHLFRGKVGSVLENEKADETIQVVFLDQDNTWSYFHPACLNLLEEAKKIDVAKCVFKVGDKVRITKGGFAGTIGEVQRPLFLDTQSPESAVSVYFNSGWHNYSPDWLELVVNKKPVYKIGDRVRAIDAPPTDLSWCRPIMDDICGKEGNVVVINTNNVYVQFGISLKSFHMKPEWLTLVSTELKAEPKKPVYKVGDRVRVMDKPPLDKKGIWVDHMDACCGKEGRIAQIGVLFTLFTQFADGSSYNFAPEWLTLIPMELKAEVKKPVYKVGDRVRVVDTPFPMEVIRVDGDEVRVRVLSNGTEAWFSTGHLRHILVDLQTVKIGDRVRVVTDGRPGIIAKVEYGSIQVQVQVDSEGGIDFPWNFFPHQLISVAPSKKGLFAMSTTKRFALNTSLLTAGIMAMLAMGSYLTTTPPEAEAKKPVAAKKEAPVDKSKMWEISYEIDTMQKTGKFPETLEVQPRELIWLDDRQWEIVACREPRTLREREDAFRGGNVDPHYRVATLKEWRGEEVKVVMLWFDDK